MPGVAANLCSHSARSGLWEGHNRLVARPVCFEEIEHGFHFLLSKSAVTDHKTVG